MSRNSIVRISAAIVLLVAASDCAREKPRPAGIPQDAVKVLGTKGTGPWQWCEFETDRTVHCKIYNINGEIVTDEQFICYSGVLPKSAADLRISPQGGPDWIQLQDGTILIAQSNRVEMTRFLDWLTGKRKER